MRHGGLSVIDRKEAHRLALKALPQPQGNPSHSDPVQWAARQGERGVVKKLYAGEPVQGFTGGQLLSAQSRGDIVALARMLAINFTKRAYLDLVAQAMRGEELTLPIRPSARAVLRAEKLLARGSAQPASREPLSSLRIVGVQRAFQRYWDASRTIDAAWRENVRRAQERQRRAAEQAEAMRRHREAMEDVERKLRRLRW